jgi:hypothetical protein
MSVDYAREVAKGITMAAVNWHAMRRDEAEIRDASPDQFKNDEGDS